MKKILALIIAAVMLLSMGTVAFADAIVFNWEDYEAQITATEELQQAWAGDFYGFEEISLVMYIPDVFTAEELAEEDVEAGFLAYLTRDDYTVTVQYLDADGMTLEEYAEYLTSEEGIDTYELEINGLPALGYSFDNDEGVEITCVAFATEMGYIFEVAFGGTNDEGFSAVAEVMIASIQAVEE